jgi:hypothetical protein
VSFWARSLNMVEEYCELATEPQWFELFTYCLNWFHALF